MVKPHHGDGKSLGGKSEVQTEPAVFAELERTTDRTWKMTYLPVWQQSEDPQNEQDQDHTWNKK